MRPLASSANTTTKQKTAIPIDSSLHFHVHDLANNQPAYDRHHYRGDHQFLAEFAGPKNTHDGRVDDIEGDTETQRQQREDPPGKPALSCVHSHLPLQLEALANDGGGFLQYFSQIAAALFLDQDGGG